MPIFTTQFFDTFASSLAFEQKATPVSNPSLVAWSKSCAELLKIESLDVATLSGNDKSIKHYATRYGGHQFGHWAGQLGDGRALFLGEINGHEIQLKGAGQTPFSRRADGRAVLRSSLREYLCSEAMHALGVPTTRALALVKTGDRVLRDMFYDGNPEYETGAIATRVAPSFIRFGHFEILASDGDKETMLKLSDWLIEKHFPQIKTKDYLAWFAEISVRTARLMAQWNSIGFVHGVMNTDNMSILGLTIDYGPYGWLDVFDPDWTPNTTDFGQRRYRYGQQPSIALWNLTRLAEAFAFMGVDVKKLESSLVLYRDTFEQETKTIWAKKLGFTTFDSDGEKLLTNLNSLWRKHPTDMTIFLRNLGSNKNLQDSFYEIPDKEFLKSVDLWHKTWEQQRDNPSQMNQANPKFIFRNYLAQLAIDELEKGDDTFLKRLTHVLERPYEEHDADEDLAAKRPNWAATRPGCATLSCSS